MSFFPQTSRLAIAAFPNFLESRWKSSGKSFLSASWRRKKATPTSLTRNRLKRARVLINLPSRSDPVATRGELRALATRVNGVTDMFEIDLEVSGFVGVNAQPALDHFEPAD
jgi:hypothetical protein